jgi:hypothetical protein
MTREQLEAWTDTAAHSEWLELRQTARHNGFEIDDEIKRDAIKRLHQIITRGQVNYRGEPDTPAASLDANAIRAVETLIKLSAANLNITTATARVLQSHSANVAPRPTDAHSLEIQSILDGF